MNMHAKAMKERINKQKEQIVGLKSSCGTGPYFFKQCWTHCRYKKLWLLEIDKYTIETNLSYSLFFKWYWPCIFVKIINSIWPYNYQYPINLILCINDLLNIFNKLNGTDPKYRLYMANNWDHYENPKSLWCTWNRWPCSEGTHYRV